MKVQYLWPLLQTIRGSREGTSRFEGGVQPQSTNKLKERSIFNNPKIQKHNPYTAIVKNWECRDATMLRPISPAWGQTAPVCQG